VTEGKQQDDADSQQDLADCDGNMNARSSGDGDHQKDVILRLWCDRVQIASMPE
jgi:hypothetical protein